MPFINPQTGPSGLKASPPLTPDMTRPYLTIMDRVDSVHDRQVRSVSTRGMPHREPETPKELGVGPDEFRPHAPISRGAC